MGAAVLAAAVFAAEAGAQSDRPYFTDLGQMNYARFLMGEKDFKTASREFARLIEEFPGSPLIVEAQFRLAEANLLAGDYREASEGFRLFLSNFKDNPLSEEARLKEKEASRLLERSIVSPSPAPAREPVIALSEAQVLRAAQVMLFEGRTYGEIEAELKRLKDAGVDTVIVRVFHNRGDRLYPVAVPRASAGVYFRTSHAPVVDDVLAGVTGAARKQGLKVFAWMTTRYADYGIEGREDLACRSFDMGERAFKRCKGLDIFNEEVVRRLEGIYSDLATYDIDGILFQDDLVLRHTEGFGPWSGEAFLKDTGYKASPGLFYIETREGKVHYTQAFWEWASWKNRRILALTDRLRKVVRQKRPGTKFAINLMYESVTNPPYALAWLSQDLEASMRSGFDYFSIMAYHRQMGDELKRTPAAIKGMIVNMAGAASRIVGDPRKVLMKVQTIDWKTGRPLADGEVIGLLKDIREAENVSLAVVPYRGDFPFGEFTGGIYQAERLDRFRR